MADWFVGQIMDKIIKACSVYLQDQHRWQTGMKDELERLRENHPKVQAVVSASTQAQIRYRNTALNSWIWQLRDAIDEAVDVLDDLEYMKLEEQLTRNKEQQKVRSTMSSLKKIGKRALKMDPNLVILKIAVMRLDKVSAKVSTFLHLVQNATQEQQVLELELCKARETGSLPKTNLVGRGMDKDFIMQWLRKPTNEAPTHIASPTLYKNISLLSIVGRGGMGKTALLQHIYEALKEEFELHMWVCVSNDFDAKKVIADMLGFLNKERPRSVSLAAFQESLKAVVQSKRFLLVLDDIWEEDMSKLENILCPLVYGGLGSKILLTTRMDTVASAVANVISKDKEIYPLKGLEEDVCLKLLITHAFDGVENLGAHKKLVDIAGSIVKKLSGSPLAAKAIGGVLNFNLNESFWMKILEIIVLNIQLELGGENIFPILDLSFKFLPQPLQNCFAFCGIFPQDHHFDKDDLVRMWIALDFIPESSIEGETLEDIGRRYFDVLVIKSFFDEFQDDERIYYKMHDLLHDLIQSISSEDCFRFVGDDLLSFKVPRNIRHLYINTENPEVLRMIKNVKNLRSLFLTTQDEDLTAILDEIFELSRRIRLLFIHSPWQEKMSDDTKYLRHLRYLNLTARLTHMPRSLSSLYHLQFIICRNKSACFDDFLPEDASNLSNLRYLKLPPNVVSGVPGIGKLRSLQELNEFNVKYENGYRIGELEHMSELRKLRIHFLENVKDAGEACTAKLFEKRKLTDLFLNWGNTVTEWNSVRGDGSLRNSVISDLDVNVLENLKPYKTLKSLSIYSHKGVCCATWMYDADLISNLEYISLNGCSEWETLPPFGQLPRLKFLYLRNMPKAKRLDYKFHGNDKVAVFPSLEVLNMEGLQALEDWFDGEGSAAYNCFFPCLTKLFLDNCPNLQELPYLPPKLKEMRIYSIGWNALNCKQGTSESIPLERLVVRSCLKITSLLLADVAELTIEACPNLICLGGLQQGAEKSIRELSFENLKSLQSLPSSLERLSSLKFLYVEQVPQLQQLLHIPASLERLQLRNLNSLQCLPSSLAAISSLEDLFFYDIPLLKSLPDLPPSLDSLHLSDLDNLQCLPSSLSAISSLNRIYLYSIPLLKSLPDLPPSLDSLNLRELDNLECLPSSLSAISSLKELHLDRIPLLKSLPDLPSSLEKLCLPNLGNLQCLPSSLSAISSLKKLKLDSISLLKSLPALPSSLNSITIKYCHPELMKRYKRISGSDWHKIAHIRSVHID